MPIRRLIGGELFDQAVRFGRPVLSSVVDAATNPQTYIQMGDQATEVLQRTLPARFQGAGFKDIPTAFTGTLDDISRMAPGAAREQARTAAKTQLNQAARAVEPTLRRPTGQTATGALRAPNVGSTSLRRPVTVSAPSTQLPQAGGPLARDYALGRSSGAVQEMADIRKILQQAPAQATSRLGRLNPLRNPGRLLNPTGLRGGILYGTAAEALLPRLGFDEKNTAAISTALTMPGGPSAKFLAGMVGYDINNPLAKGTLDSISENLSPEQQALRDKLLKERIAAGTQKATVGNNGLMNLPPSVNTNLEAYDESVTLPAVESAGNAGGYSPPPATNLPPSPEETPAMMDPYAYNLAVYGQGRTAAGTQEERKAVQNLGMAIHQRLFPKLNNQTSFNPLMARTFPDRYSQSLEAFIEERGIQKPNSMNEVDAATALADATNVVEPLITPEVAEQLRLARQQGRL